MLLYMHHPKGNGKIRNQASGPEATRSYKKPRGSKKATHASTGAYILIPTEACCGLIISGRPGWM